MTENELVLKQHNSLGLGSQIKLLDGRELQVISKNKKKQKSFSVDLLSLQDKSKAVVVIAWKWVAVAISFLLVTLLFMKILPDYLTDNKNLYLGIILFAGLIGCILSFIQFWKYSYRKKIFYSKNAHVPIIELFVGKPSKKIFSEFISEVESQIKSFSKRVKITEEKLLIGEMKMLRRLSDNGIISKKMYEVAKIKLFTGFDSQVIDREA